MTWLKGQTTYANLISDLTKLIAGEIADGVGTTASSGDKWVRPYAGVDYLQCPSAVALGNMSNRAGYWALNTYGASMAAPMSSVCKQTAIVTGAGVSTRWHVEITINTANTTPGDYSTLRFGWNIWDIDTAQFLSGNSGVPPTTSSGVYSSNTTVLGTIQFSDPSGIIAVGTKWSRSFTSTYKGGVDYFGPMFPKHTAAPTFSVNPPGTAGTDYDVIERAGTVDVFGISGGALLGGNAQGVGVLTNTFLTGAKYTYTFSVAKHSMHMVPNTFAGQIDLRWGGGYDNTNGRDYGHQKITQWLRPYQTPASVTSGSLVQYWISVKPDKVVVVLNADPGQSGKLTVAAMGVYTPQSPTYDKFPVWCSGFAQDYLGGGGNVNVTLNGWMKPNGQKRRQDGSDAAVRDWQTGWTRNDFWNSPFVGGTVSNGSGGGLTSDPDPGVLGYTTLSPVMGMDTNSSFGSTGAVPSRQPKPNPFDGNWWLYGYTMSGISSGIVAGGLESVGPVGAITDKTLIVPGDGWSSGDEVTETSTSKVWFLIAPDYAAIPSRFRVGTNLYQGGLAVLEE